MPTPYHINKLDELQPNRDDNSIPVVLHRPHDLVVVPEQVLDEARLVLVAQGQPGCEGQGGVSGMGMC